MLDSSLPADGVLEEEILFDADRDNGGKGVTPDEIITMLRQLRQDEAGLCGVSS